MSFHFSLESARRSRRAHVYMSGELVVGKKTLKVTIRDISQNGALVICEEHLGENSKVELKRGSLCAPGHVAWSHGRHAGLKFDEPVPTHVLEKTLPRALLRSLDIDP
jgi:hypothetical protein